MIFSMDEVAKIALRSSVLNMKPWAVMVSRP